MKLTRSIAKALIAAVTAASLMAAETAAPAPASQAPDLSAAQPLVDAFGAIGALIANADKPAAPASQAEGFLKGSEKAATPEAASGAVEQKSGEAPAAKAPRSAKNSVILITSGAAAGAAAGAALGKGSKSAMVGAALGGAVGLIYDRMTYKNPGKI